MNLLRLWLSPHMDWKSLPTARQATLPHRRFWWAKLTTSDDLGIFATHVTTYDLHMTLMTNGDGILMTVKTNGEDTLMTPFTTHDYLVSTPNDITDNPCDDIDDLYYIHCPHDWDQVTKRMKRWQQGWLMTITDDMANLLWQPMWLLQTTPDDWSDNQNTTPTTLMTTGDYLWWSMSRPVDDPGPFLTTSDDSIWRYLSPKSKVACLAGANWTSHVWAYRILMCLINFTVHISTYSLFSHNLKSVVV